MTKSDRNFTHLQILCLDLLIVLMWIYSNAWMTILFFPTLTAHVHVELSYRNYKTLTNPKKQKTHTERICALSEKGYKVWNHEERPDILARIEINGRLAFKFDYFKKTLTFFMADGYYNYHRDGETFLKAEKELGWLLDNKYITKATFKRMYAHVDEFLSMMEKHHWEEFALLTTRKVD